MTYRKDIDGLRAIAILPVLLFHAGFDLFRGGFVGVDIFFVISGYLITALILKEKEEGSFSIMQFYERRARRILPALFFVMLCCLPCAWHWLLPSDLDDFSDSLIATVLFVSNIHFYRETGYFAPDADHQPLLHTWSLSIEEQYYLLFPLLLSFLWFLGRKALFYIVTATALCSLLAAELAGSLLPSEEQAAAPGEVTAASDFAFYLLPTRAWELLAGAIAAFHLHGRADNRRGNQSLSLIGLALILYAIATFDDGTPHPGVYTLLPVIGTVLVILFTTPDTLCARLLSTPILVGIGLISYSVYLWHQPLFAFFRLQSPEAPSETVMMLLAMASLALGWLSWRYVEQPFRDRKKFSRRRIFQYSALGSAFFLGLGLTGNAYDGFLDRYPPNERDLIVASDTREMGFYIYSRYEPFKDQPFSPNAGLKVLVAGDSYGQDLINMLAEAGGLDGVSLSIHEISSHCGNLYLENDFSHHIKADNLAYCRQQGWYGGEGLQDRLREADVVFIASSWPLWTAELLPESINNLKTDFGSRVIVIGKKYFGNINPLSYLGISDQEKTALVNTIQGKHPEINQMMAGHYDNNTFVNLIDLFCENGRDCKIFTPEAKLISYDGGHLTKAGAIHLGKKLITHPLIRDALELDGPRLAKHDVDR